MPVSERKSGGGGTILAVGCAIVAALVILVALLGVFGLVGYRRMVTTTIGPMPPIRPGSGSGSSGTSIGMDMAIPDNRSKPAEHVFDIQDGGSPGATIRAAKLDLEIDHPRPEDLEIKLRHPDGTVVVLRRAGTGGRASAKYPEDTPPAESLVQLQGKPTAGKWKLTVTDKRVAKTGRLKSAGLDLDYVF